MPKEQVEIERVGLSDHVTGYPEKPMPAVMTPEMMRRLLGGKFPDTGFSWDCVYEFRYEPDEVGGTWEPYNQFGEILPGNGFKVTAEMQPML